MSCEELRRGFAFYIYGELPAADEEQIEHHVATCEGCRVEMEREKRLHGTLDSIQEPAPKELLERCREELPRTLRRVHRESSRRSVYGRLRAFWSFPGVPWPQWLKPVGAVALVTLGFFTARLTTGPGDRVRELPEAERVNQRVRFVEPSDSGRLRVFVDETRQRVIEGGMEDEAIRDLLLAAARDPLDPGVRAESLEWLRGKPESREIRDVLLQALEHDMNAGVRLKAMEGLKPYVTDRESRRVLSKILLSDENPGVRSMAIDLLIASDQPDVVETLQALLEKEKDSYIRLRSQRALKAMKASMETF